MGGDTYERALVMGLGVSGVAAARLLSEEGCHVVAIDRQVDSGLSERVALLEGPRVRVLLGCDEVPLEPFDVCVVSPGVAVDSAWVREMASRQVPVISELELGYRRCRCPLLAVTGTNGKSTLVKLCGDALAASGRKVRLAGNYGLPLCAVAATSGELDWAVVEVSSFQLETVVDFRPRVGVLLNIQPNHLDRHPDLQTYRAIKARLFARMGAGDVAAVLDVNLGEIAALSGRRTSAPEQGARWVSFGLTAGADYRYAASQVLGRRPDGGALSIAGTLFDNPILGQSAAAAMAAMDACGVGAEVLGRAIRQFEPLPHRMREIARLRGVRFVDDSKATTLAALNAALQMSEGPVRLIAGGLLKEHELAVVKEMLAKTTRGVYLIGKASRELEDAWIDTVRCVPCGTLEQAVRRAWLESAPGETILLAPACASFDQFKNYEDRGNQFIRIVRSINEEQ